MVLARVLHRVVVASSNPVKLNSVKSAFQRSLPGRQFEFQGVSVPSDVPDQPTGDEQTLQGARNRVKNASLLHPNALCVAIEGGVSQDIDGRSLECFAWAVIHNPVTQAEGKARSASFVLPRSIAELVNNGMELGDADDKVFGRSKSGFGSGTVGYLTKGVISRTDYYDHTVCLALIPFLNEQHYPGCTLQVEAQ